MEDIIFDHLIEEDKQLYLEHKIKTYHFVCPECKQVYITNKYNFKKSPRCKKCGDKASSIIRKKNNFQQEIYDNLKNQEDKENYKNGLYDTKSKYDFVCSNCKKTYSQTIACFKVAKTHMCKKCANHIGMVKRRGKDFTNKELQLKQDNPNASYVICENCNKEFVIYSHKNRKPILCHTCSKSYYGKKHFLDKYFRQDIYDSLVLEEDKQDYHNGLIKYKNTSRKLMFKCNCGKSFFTSLFGYCFDNKVKCDSCTIKSTSLEELNLRKIVSQYVKNDLIYNDRSILSNKEIDLYIPALKIGFEYNGNYWHSEERLKIEIII